MRDELTQILRADVERLVGAVASLPGPERPQVRALALRVWQALEAGAGVADVVALVQEVELRLAPRERGQPVGSVWQMRRTQPWRQVIRPTLVADRAVAWQAQWDARWQVRVAVSAARRQWLETRLNPDAPIQVATVRQPESKDGREALELLHKRGTTRFS